MKVEKVSKLPIIHFVAETQQELTTAFIRMSEFYESPYPEINGKFFNLKDYKKAYIKDHGKFSYYSDWSGYNIPSRAIKDFILLFGEKLTPKEKFIIGEIEKITGNAFTRKRYYVIGTYKSSNQRETFLHEVAHSLYDLKRNYKSKCDYIFSSMTEENKKKIKDVIVKMGYNEDVVEDECQAYFTTDSLRELIDRFEFEFDKIPIKEIYEYQKNFELYYVE